jgi:serine/threonine-protein kinase
VPDLPDAAARAACFTATGARHADIDESEDDPAGRPQTRAGHAGSSATSAESRRYVGLAPHARGGLGEVFTATDTELHRVVALKRLRDHRAGDPASRRRFLLEAEVTARLEHPGVVPVHSLFHDEAGRPCYSMKFIEGQTLDDALRAYHAGPPDPVAFRRLLQSFLQVCETIAYAHSRGVIHRDLKPQNIMLGKFGEAVVVDWGLAKIVGRPSIERPDSPEVTLRPVGDSSGEETQMGAAVGTPAYMSPEQAAGRWDVINPASDVYNLGAVLYAVLVGRPPLEKGNWPELQQKIQRGDYPRPRAVNPAVPRPLEAVCRKAMALDPEARYPSALALASDVERWLADEPVTAYRERLTERLWRWARRRKDLVAVGVSGLIACVTVAVGAWIVKLERQKAEFERKSRIADQGSMNSRALGGLTTHHYELDREVRATLDQVASRVSHDPRLSGKELQPLRADLLQRVMAFWDKALAIDAAPKSGPGWRSHFYRAQRAICLARLGEHRQAAEEAEGLWATTNERSAEAAYDLARAYSL